MILLASSHDYANLIHNQANALRSIGVDAVDVTLHRHELKYPTQSQIVTRQQLSDLTRKAEMVIIGHSCPTILSLNKCNRYAVYHSGTRYRNNPEHFNKLFRGAFVSLSDQTEFMSLGNHRYIVSAIDPGLYQPVKRKPGKRKLIVGHFPSNAEVKGTADIIRMLEPFKKDFEIRIDTKVLPYEKNLERIREVDIYIELFKPELNGKPYGCFGVTALEAAMLGKFVITQDIQKFAYPFTYGHYCSPLHLANSETEFNDHLVWLKQNGFATTYSEDIHQRTTERHSPQATGNLLMKYLYE